MPRGRVRRLNQTASVPLLEAGKVELALPPFFATPNTGKSAYAWKLVNPLTKIRNIAKRGKNLVVELSRNVNLKKPLVGYSYARPFPKLRDFSPADRAKFEHYVERFNETRNSPELVGAEPIENLPRGFPPVLPKNARKAGLTATHHKVYYSPPDGDTDSIPEAESPVSSRESSPRSPPSPPSGTRGTRGTRGTQIKTLDEFKAISPNKRVSQALYLDEILEQHKDLQLKSTSLSKSGKYDGKIVILGKLDNGKWRKAVDGSNQKVPISGVSGTQYEELYADLLRQLRGLGFRPQPTAGGGGGRGLSLYNKESDAYESGDDEGESGGDLSGFVNKLIHGRNEFSPASKRVLEANGRAIITGIALHRNPLPSLYKSALSFLSGGETDRILDESNKDKLFHLSMWVKLSNGKTVKIDKTTSVNVAQSPTKPAKEESLEVVGVPQNLSLNEFLNKTLEKVGVSRFFSYDAKTNNCSDFVQMLLEDNGMWKEPAISFVEQPVQKLLERFGLLSKIVKGITDLGHRADIISQGGKISRKSIMRASRITSGVKMIGGATPRQKGLSAQTRTFTTGLLREKLSQIVHSGDRNQSPTAPFYDPENLHDDSADPFIEMAERIRTFDIRVKEGNINFDFPLDLIEFINDGPLNQYYYLLFRTGFYGDLPEQVVSRLNSNNLDRWESNKEVQAQRVKIDNRQIDIDPGLFKFIGKEYIDKLVDLYRTRILNGEHMDIPSYLRLPKGLLDKNDNNKPPPPPPKKEEEMTATTTTSNLKGSAKMRALKKEREEREKREAEEREKREKEEEEKAKEEAPKKLMGSAKMRALKKEREEEERKKREAGGGGGGSGLEGGDLDALHQVFIHGLGHGGGMKPVDWEDMNWGSFTAQFKRFKEEHPHSGVDNLEEFAEMILEHPEDFRAATLKRARFYLNVILKSHHSNMMSHGGALHHPALTSDLYPRIPQAYSQLYFSHPHPIVIHSPSGEGLEGGKLSLHSFEKGAKKFFTKTLPKTLIHQGIPTAVGMATTALTDNPALGAIASKTVGKASADAVGKVSGMGVKRFAKGSLEAKEHMRKLREMRKPKIKGGLVPSPHSRSSITEPSLLR